MRDPTVHTDTALGGFEQALRGDGFDLVVPRGLAVIRSDFARLGLPLPTRPNPLGVFVGNTRALWPRFLAVVRSSPELQRIEHPLDTWVEQRVRAALAAVGVVATPYFAHRRLPQGYLPLQHWAQQLGALALSPSHLSVHPEYGPWLALRALVVVELEADAEHVAPPAVEPCAACPAPCRIPFEQAATKTAQLVGTRRVTDHWRLWLAVREACPVGRSHRYTDEQIRYHYGRDPSALRA